MGGRCSCRSVEFTWVGIGFVATDLAKRRVDEVRVIANYSIGSSVPRKSLPLSCFCQGCNSCEGNFT